MTYSGSAVESCSVAGVDWITATSHNHAKYALVEGLFAQHHAREARDGRQAKPSQHLQYYGLRTDHSFIGRSDQGIIMQATGALAHGLSKSITSLADNVSRIDLQVTLPQPDVAGALKNVFDSVATAPAIRGTRPQAKSYFSQRGHETVYIGAPTSDQRGRSYDKFLESGREEYSGTVRYEVQLRREAALRTARHLCAPHLFSPSAIANFVLAWYAMRNVHITPESVGGWQVPKEETRESKPEQQCRWIAAQVSTVFLSLMENNYADRAVAALLSKSPEQRKTAEALMKLLEAWRD